MLVTSLANSGFSFGQKTWYTSHHLGQDKSAYYQEVSFPVDLFKCEYYNGIEGGLTVVGEDSAGYIHRFLHNSEFRFKERTIKAGVAFVVTGNSGQYTTGPHLHWDVRKPGTNRSDLIFANFIDPIQWEREILPNLLNMSNETLPEWFAENKTQEWAEKSGIITDWKNKTEFTPKYKHAEYLRKGLTRPTIRVNVILNSFTLSSKDEQKAYSLAKHHCTQLYSPFCNLVFQAPEKRMMGKLKYISAGPAVRVADYTPAKGINLIITDDKDLAELSKKVAGGDLIGYAIHAQNTILIRRSSLLVEDMYHRTALSLFAATLPHEISHIVADKLKVEDLTHFYDYGFTLVNFLQLLPFPRLNMPELMLELNLA